MKGRWLGPFVGVLLLWFLPLAGDGGVYAEPRSPGDLLSPEAIFGTDKGREPVKMGYALESIRSRFTHFEQRGLGAQSRARLAGQPVIERGSEEAQIEQPQVEVIARQGERLRHRIWAPVDVVTAASPDAVDAVSTASRITEAGSLNVLSTYKVNDKTDVGLRANFHLEENFRSWMVGLLGSRSFAEDNTVISASVNQILDWFDKYDLSGDKEARVFRSTTNANLGLTQLLSPTTVAQLSYAVTVQLGTLGNTWNSVPLENGTRGDERLPTLRQRHAFVGRLAQYLPILRGASLKGGYRYYVDDWGISAHTLDLEGAQRLLSMVYLRFGYRFHHQSAASFFTTLAELNAPLRTADSDLEGFIAHTLGGAVFFDIPLRRSRVLSFDLGYERYFRTNNLEVDIYSCSVALRF